MKSPFKVFENGTIRQIIYGVVLVCHCKYVVPFSSYLTPENDVILLGHSRLLEMTLFDRFYSAHN